MNVKLLFGAVALSVMSTASFAQIIDLYNTGANVSADGLYDLAYTVSSDTLDARLTQQGGDVTASWAAELADANNYPVSTGNWLNDDPTTRWITPDALINQGSEAAGFGYGSVWYYTTTFTVIDGADLGSLSISGKWMTDNYGMAILINGQDAGYSTTHRENDFLIWEDFVLTQGFQYGENELTFVIQNSADTAGPSGVRIAMDGAIVPVPEPSTYAMLGLGALMVGVMLRRRRV